MAKLRERVVHSSLSQYKSNDDDLTFGPSEAPKLGCLVRTGWHSGLSRQMADVYWQSPILSPTSQGEYVELSELEEFLRVKILSIAKECRKHGKELIEHAKRLEEIACRENITDELPEVDHNPGTAYTHHTPILTPESESKSKSESKSSQSAKSTRKSKLDWSEI